MGDLDDWHTPNPRSPAKVYTVVFVRRELAGRGEILLGRKKRGFGEGGREVRGMGKDQLFN